MVPSCLILMGIMWYYTCYGTKCEECNTMSLSLTSIDAISSKWLRCSRYKCVYYYIKCIQLSSTHQSTRKREKEKTDKGLWTETHLPLHIHPLNVIVSSGYVDLKSVSILTQPTNGTNLFKTYELCLSVFPERLMPHDAYSRRCIWFGFDRYVLRSAWSTV